MPQAQRVLKAIEGRLRRIKPGAEAAPGIIAIDTAGHTPAHLPAGRVRSEKVLVTGDAIQNAHVSLLIPSGNRARIWTVKDTRAAAPSSMAAAGQAVRDLLLFATSLSRASGGSSARALLIPDHRRVDALPLACLTLGPLALDHRHQRLEAVGLGGGLVPADAVDAREAHGDARLVARGAGHRVECHLEHQFGLNRGTGPKPRACGSCTQRSISSSSASVKPK